MADYDLSKLESRSFEQLVQTIAAKVVGPNIIVFGDGPDGGREATFDGYIPYPFQENGWNGYGVIQAKFRKRVEDSQRDGQWAVQQLQTELKKFTDSNRSLRKPEYYIFATNVVLTPVQDIGTSDKAHALVQELSEDLQLKDYDIWDYDKICRFIDGHEDIRRAYAAWIMPGDVLIKMIEKIETLPSDSKDKVLFEIAEKSIVKITQKQAISKLAISLGSLISLVFMAIYAPTPSLEKGLINFIVTILILTLVVLSFIYLDYFRILFLKDNVIGKLGEYIGGGWFARKKSDKNYLKYKVFTGCSYTNCEGTIYIADPPPKEKDNHLFVGICTVGKKNHTYKVDANGVGEKATFDWRSREEQ